MSEKKYYAGLDIGTSFIKAVILDNAGETAGSFVGRSSARLKDSIAGAMDDLRASSGVSDDDIGHITATGFGRGSVRFADSDKTEIACHARGAYHEFRREITIIDIGGQDTKIIHVTKDGKTSGFRMNRKCAAGTGMFLEEIALRLNIPLEDMNGLARDSAGDIALNSYCTVFAKTEILTRIKEGETLEDMVRGAFESVVKRVVEMDTLEGTIVMTGGVVAHNDVLVDILKRHVDGEILVPKRPQLAGALGAALFARDA